MEGMTKSDQYFLTPFSHMTKWLCDEASDWKRQHDNEGRKPQNQSQ